MADYPLTEDDIKTRLNTINNLIDTYLADPAKFHESVGGSIKISIKDYVAALREERAELRTQLENFPYFEDSDVELVNRRFF